MNIRGAVTFYCVASILVLWFSLSAVTSILSGPFNFASWLNAAICSYGVYYLFLGAINGDSEAVNFAARTALFSGCFSLLLSGIYIFQLRDLLLESPPGTFKGNILWLPFIVLLLLAVMKSVFGAALWLPSVQNFLRHREFRQIMDE